LGFVVFLALGISAHAQRGNLHGTVIVPNGAPIPGASVTVLGVGEPKTATTNQAGQYVIEDLPAGRYSVKVKAPGFDVFDISVAVASNDNREVDAVLTLSPPPVQPTPNPAESVAAEAATPTTPAAPQNPAPLTAQAAAPAAQAPIKERPLSMVWPRTRREQ